VILVAPKLRRIKDVIGRHSELGQHRRVLRAFFERETRRRVRKNADPFIRYAIKHLHLFLPCIRGGNNVGSPF